MSPRIALTLATAAATLVATAAAPGAGGAPRAGTPLQPFVTVSDTDFVVSALLVRPVAARPA